MQGQQGVSGHGFSRAVRKQSIAPALAAEATGAETPSLFPAGAARLKACPDTLRRNLSADLNQPIFSQLPSPGLRHLPSPPSPLPPARERGAEGGVRAIEPRARALG